MLSFFHWISSAVSSRSTRAGMPAASERGGMRASAFTKAIAATIASSPTSALSFTTQFMPIERAAPQHAAVQHRAVAHRRLRADHRVLAREAVQHAGVLDVGAFLHHDAPEVAAQAGAGPDVGARAHDHVADQHGALVHERGRMDHGDDPVDGIHLGHGADFS